MPSTDIAIRPATVADMPAVQAIYADEVIYGTATFELDPPDLATITRRFETIQGGGMPWLVAERDGGLLGYAYVGSHRARPAYRFTVEDSVYLARGARGQGIGTLLMTDLMMATRAAGFRQVIAVIGDSANLGSVNLHRRAGFLHVGTMKDVGLKFDRWLDTVIMQLPLGEGAGSIPAT